MATVDKTNERRTLNAQVARWTFTYNNYNLETDYEAYFKQRGNRIKKMVVGFERGAGTSSRHMQGFVEFKISFRYSVVRQILPDAYWHPALRSTKANYEYCSKSGDFFVIGSFQKEQKQTVSVRSMIWGLLDEGCSLK